MHRTDSLRPLIVLAAFASLLTIQHLPGVAWAGEPTGQLAEFAKFRTWSDASGKFQIEAQLTFASADEVQLTQANGKIVKIPVEKLSPSDQEFVRRFLNAEQTPNKVNGDSQNPFQVLGAGAMLDFNSSSEDSAAKSGSSQGPSGFAKREAIVNGAKQIQAKLDKPFWSVTPPLGFPEVHFDNRVIQTKFTVPFLSKTQVLSAGKTGISVLGAYGADKPAEEAYSRFVMARAQDGFVSQVLELNALWHLMAISADGKRVAVRRDDWGMTNDVGIFRVTHTGLVPEFQFSAGGSGNSWDKLRFITFAAGDRLVTINEKHLLIVWDLANEQGPKVIFHGSSGGSHHAALSPAGELMALLAGTSIAVIDIQSAKVVGLIARKAVASQISFSPDGSLLAAFEPFEVAIYNLSDGMLARTLPVAEHRKDVSLHWVGKHLLVGSLLYDVDRALPLWTYEGDPASRTTLGSYLFSGFGDRESSSLTIQQVPHAAVLAKAATVDPANIYAISPGDAIKVEYNFNTTPDDVQTGIRRVIETKLIELGWRLSRDAPNTLLIELQEGQPDTVEYRIRKLSSPSLLGPVYRSSGSGKVDTETISFIPWTHKATILADGEQVFQDTHIRTPPNGLAVSEGETTQSAATMYCQPTPSHFRQLPIPPYLLKLEFQGGLGSSKLTANGWR